MTITCAVGIALFNAHKSGGDPTQILCRLKGVDRPDQLTRAELRELTAISEAFNKAALAPKDVRDVRIEFVLGDHFVTLGKFSELDITLQALDMVEDFNPEGLERMPVMLGCIYAPIVKHIFDLPEPVAKVAADISDAIREQVPFEDVFSVFDFFVLWKESSTRVPSPSFKHSMNIYRLRRRAQWPIRLLVNRSLKASRSPSAKITRAIKNSIFIATMLVAILNRWFWLTIASLREWWAKRRTK
jgi:hypothetical protein